MHGILVMDKPEGITSFGLVKKVRYLLGVKKAGHTGTLDPLATGVLPICLGEATKVAGVLLAEDKAYEATALLGRETDTLDITGQTTASADPGAITEAQVEQALESFIGEQEQVPPAYSAIRVDGRRAHQLAREGKPPKLEPRQVVIHRLELCGWDSPRATFKVECSKGTYIRTLISDLGRLLGCGATMESLRRTASGAFDLSRSIPLDDLRARLEAGDLPLVSLDEALVHLPGVDVDEAGAHHLRHGQPLPPPAPDLPDGQMTRVRLEDKVIALGEIRGGRLWPKRIFHG